MKKCTLLVAAVLVAMTASAEGLKVGELSNLRQLTQGSDRYESPKWSPDAQRVSFTQEGYNGLYVMNPDGTDLRQISDASGVGYMHQWSIDSREILVRDTRWVTEGDGVNRYHAAWSIDMVGKKTRLTQDAIDMQPAAWRYTRDGAKSVMAPGQKLTQVALQKAPSVLMAEKTEATYNVSYICDCESLTLVDANGNKRVLYNGAAFCPVTSPDGKMVAFNAMDDVMVMNLDGTGLRKIDMGFNPTWVNNSQIVYERTTDNGHDYLTGELYLASINGSSIKAITSTSSTIEMYPCASADGSKLLFVNWKDGQIYSADLR